MRPSNKLLHPTFLYIGAAKAGSSWIFEALYDHPEIFVPIAKDIRYFENYYTQHDFSWYLKQFSEATSDHKAIGEVSHDYFINEVYADRIKEHLPDVKLIACLREPTSLMESAYNYGLIHDKAQTISQEHFIVNSVAAQHIAYLRNLTWFYDRFGSDKVLIVFYEDLQRDSLAFIQEVYAFLGVSVDHQPAVLKSYVNPAKSARLESLTQFSYVIARYLRKLGLVNLVGAVKRSSLADRLFYTSLKGGKKPLLLKQEIIDQCTPTYPELEALIGKKLPSEWYDVIQVSE
jgi:hypothetical protein